METESYSYVVQNNSDLSTDIVKQVAYYCLRENNTQTSCIKRDFNFSYRQTGKIMDVLEKMGIFVQSEIIRLSKSYPLVLLKK